MIAGQLELQLIADVAQLRTDMDEMVRIVNSTSQKMESAFETATGAIKGMFSNLAGQVAGFLSIRAFVGWIEGAIDLQARLYDLNLTTGISVEKLAGLKMAAEEGGSSLEGVARSVTMLERNIGRNPDMFKKLGITSKDGLEQLKQFSDVFRALPDQATRAAVSFSVMGRNWMTMAPLLAKGSEEIQRLIDLGTELAGIDTQSATANMEYKDRMVEFHTAVGGLAVTLGNALLPGLTKLATDMRTAAEGTDKLSGATTPLQEAFRTLVIGAGYVSFQIVELGKDIGALFAKLTVFDRIMAVPFGKGWLDTVKQEYEQVGVIQRARAKDYDDSKKSFDAWKKSWQEMDMTAKGAAASAAKTITLTAEQKAAAEELAKHGGRGAGNSAAERAYQDSLNAEVRMLQNNLAEKTRLSKEAVTEIEHQRKMGEISEIAGIDAVYEAQHTASQAAIEAAQAEMAVIAKKHTNQAQLAGAQGKLDAALAADKELSAQHQNKVDEYFHAIRMKQIKDEMDMQRQYDEEWASYVAQRANEFNQQVMQDQEAIRAGEDELKLLAAEGQLLGANHTQRYATLALLREQLRYEKEIEDIENTAWEKADKNIAKQKADARHAQTVEIINQNAALEDQKKIWDDLDHMGHDFWMNLLDGGESALHKLGDAIKKYLWDALYQLTVQKWLVNVQAAVTGGGGSSTGLLGGLLGGGTNGGGGLLGNITNGMSIVNALRTGYAGSVGSVVGSLFGTTAGNAALGVSLGYGSASSAAAASAASIAGGGTAAGAGIGATIGAAIPYVAIAYALYSMFKGGETRSGGQYSDTKFLEGPSGGEIGGDSVRTLITQTTDRINSTIAALGGTATVSNLQSGLETSEHGKGFAYAGGTLSSGATFGQSTHEGGIWNRRGSMNAQEATAAYTEEMQQAVLQALQAANLPGKVGEYLAQLGDIDKLTGGALTKAAADFDKYAAAATASKQLTAAVSGFGPVFENIANLSVEAGSALVTMAGGIDALTANLDSYYTNFYSAEEQRLNTAKNITKVINDAGGNVTVDSILTETRVQYRAMVEAAAKDTSEAGQKLWVALISVSGAFASITTAAQDTANATQDAADTAQKAQAIADERYGLETQMLELQGNTVELRARELLKLDESNRALQQRIWELQDEQALVKSIDVAYGNYIQSLRDEASALQQSIDTHRGYAQALRSYLTQLTIGEQSQLSPQDQYNASKTEFNRVAQLAASGNEAGLSALQSTADAFLNASRVYNASSGKYFIDLAAVKGAVEGTANSQQTLLDIDQMQLNTLNSMLDRLGMIDGSVNRGTTSQEKNLQILTEAVKSLLHSGGVPSPVAISATTTNPSTGTTNITGPNSINEVMHAINWDRSNWGLAVAQTAKIMQQNNWLGSQIDAAMNFPQGETVNALASWGFSAQGAPIDIEKFVRGLDWGTPAADANSSRQIYGYAMLFGLTAGQIGAPFGFSAADINKMVNLYGYPSFAEGGMHEGGWAMVGERGPELAYMPPSRIYSADETQQMVVGGDNEALLSEIKELRESNSNLLTSLIRVTASIGKTSIEKQSTIAENTKSNNFNLSAAPVST